MSRAACSVSAMAGKFRRRTSIVGNPFTVEGTLLGGEPLDWSQYAGKVVLVDFWASWCGPCGQSFPWMAEIQQRYADRGLVVPALRNTDQRSIPEIARELARLAEQVRDGDFGLEDLRGGTFTISNLGAIGGTYSTPIINVPEVAILLVGRARKMPVVVDDEVKIRLMLPLSLSYDHRLVDGREAVTFLVHVKERIEDPTRILLEV